MKNTIEAKTLRELSDLLNQVSSATGLTPTQLETQFEDVQVTVYRFENRTLVPPEDFDSIIDIWADSIKTQIRSQSKISVSPQKSIAKSKTTRIKPSATQSAATTKAKKKKTVAAKKARRKPTTKASVAKKTGRKARARTSLPLPDNYQSVVSHLYGPSLKRIMPKDQPGQKTFLAAIANESDDGVALLNELSTLIAKKYTGKMATKTAYNGLKNKAQVLLDEISGNAKRKVNASRRRKAIPRGRKKRK